MTMETCPFCHQQAFASGYCRECHTSFPISITNAPTVSKSKFFRFEHDHDDRLPEEPQRALPLEFMKLAGQVLDITRDDIRKNKAQRPHPLPKDHKHVAATSELYWWIMGQEKEPAKAVMKLPNYIDHYYTGNFSVVDYISLEDIADAHNLDLGRIRTELLAALALSPDEERIVSQHKKPVFVINREDDNVKRQADERWARKVPSVIPSNSKFHGVYKEIEKMPPNWRAYVIRFDTFNHLGYFPTEMGAAIRYNTFLTAHKIEHRPRNPVACGRPTERSLQCLVLEYPSELAR